MKTKHMVKLFCFCLLPFAFRLSASAQGTAFTYQGRLNDGVGPASGIYDLRFTIYDSTNLPGSVVAGPLANSAAGVSNGLFSVALDFGAGVFPGADRWLEIAVRTNNGGAFTTLVPRQQLTPTPYAITAENVTPGAGLSGTYGGAVTLNNSANQFTGSFTGNGANLTNVNALTLGGLSAVSFWKTVGNAGTAAGTNFVGTTDNQPLELRVNGQRALRLEPTSDTPNVIGGSVSNSVSPGLVGATIGGGGIAGSFLRNLITGSGNYATIGGGYGNMVIGNVGAVLGGVGNRVSGNGGVVGGGQNNYEDGHYSWIGGGSYNALFTNANYSVIGGGVFNLIEDNTSYGTIGGGYNNFIGTNSADAFIGGGIDNSIGASTSDAVISGGFSLSIGDGAFAVTMSGGRYNSIGTNNSYSTIAGGYNNTMKDNVSGSSIGGGTFNSIGTNDDSVTIAGGIDNLIDENVYGSTIGGGYLNSIAPGVNGATIAGGSRNQAAGRGAFIGGGGVDGTGFVGNAANGDASSIVGGFGNTNLSDYASIGGGYRNLIQSFASSSAIGGGNGNTIQTFARYATIGGGIGNLIQPNTYYTTIAGGFNNMISTNQQLATVGGGSANAIGGFVNFLEVLFPDTANTISGGAANYIAEGAGAATIAGGENNRINGHYAAIPGGDQNVAGGQSSFAAGHRARANLTGDFVWADATEADFNATVSNQFAVRASGGVKFVTSGAGMLLDGFPVLLGGANNINLGSQSFTGGGNSNTIQNGTIFSTISGGWNNTIQAGAFQATIGGGAGNSIMTNASVSTISGGTNNTIQDNASWSTIGGGCQNQIQVRATAATIAGGANNQIQTNGSSSTIAGGFANVIQATNFDSTIGGGAGNTIHTNASAATIAGGFYNEAAAPGVFVGGGGWDGFNDQPNVASGVASTIVGGVGNTNLSGGAGIGGGYYNSIRSTADYSAIGGGYENLISSNAQFATIGAGANNSIASLFATIAGGGSNSIGSNSLSDVISGGYGHKIGNNTFDGTIGGGSFSSIGTNAYYATIAGGHNNSIQNNATGAAIAGGTGNQIVGSYGVVPGGDQNVAGTNAFAAGHRAKANFQGDFVWADSTDADFAAAQNDQFVIRAAGGVGIGTASPQHTLHLLASPTTARLESTGGNGSVIEMWSSVSPSSSIGSLNFVNGTGPTFEGQISYVSTVGIILNAGGAERMRITAGGNVGIGTSTPTNKLHVNGGITCTALTQSSDRNAKENFTPVSPRAVLAKVAALPISTWNFKELHDGRHMGPMAQDFYAAFGLGGSETTITSVDPDGVALAAIQGLNQKLEDRLRSLQEQLNRRESENAGLKQRLDALEKSLHRQTSN